MGHIKIKLFLTGCGKKNFSSMPGGIVVWSNPYGKQCGDFA